VLLLLREAVEARGDDPLNSLWQVDEIPSLDVRTRVLLGVQRIASDLHEQGLLPFGREHRPVE
jgi:hypothetical protein